MAHAGEGANSAPSLPPPLAPASIKTVPAGTASSTLPVADSRLRQKVPLGAGASHTSWMRLVHLGKPLSPHAPTKGAPLRSITMSEVRQHASRDDAWLVVRGGVYDVTPYCEFHPGGVEEIMRGVGDDATELFDEFHPWVSIEGMLRPCLIGRLVPDPTAGSTAAASIMAQHALGGTGFSSSSPAPAASFGPSGTASAAMRVGGMASGSGTTLKLLTSASTGKWHRVAVLYNKPLSDDGTCVLLRVQLATRQQRLGLEYGGKHVRVRVPDPGAASGEGKPFREYTPVSPLSAAGYFDLAVKVYPEGKVSPALGGLGEGDVVEISGPRGEVKYTHGIATWGRKVRQASALCFAVAGSGVTPALQIARAVADDKSDSIPVHVVVCHRSDSVAMLNRDFVALAMEHDNIHLTFVTSATPDAAAAPPARITHSRIAYVDGSRVTPAVLAAAWPKPAAKTACMWCGPPGFNKAMDDAVRELYYVADNCFQF